jgi:DNA-binding NarL/FixJ family response regulator
MDPSTRRRPLRVLLADAAPMQRSGLRMALTGAGSPAPGLRSPRAGASRAAAYAGHSHPADSSSASGSAEPPHPADGSGTTRYAGPPHPADGSGATRYPGPPHPADGSGATRYPGPPQPAEGSGATHYPGPSHPADGSGGAGFAGADEGDDEIVIAGEAGDGVEAMSLARRLLPDVLVTDLVLPRADGLAVARSVVEAGLPVRVLVLAGDDCDEHALAAIAAGAVGFLPKDVPAEELTRAVRAVAAGGAVIAPVVLARILARVAEALPAPETTAGSALDALTEREREVLVHVARGHSNAEIAGALQVSETTVKTHVGHLLTKLRLRDRTQAVVLAYETGLIRPGT